MENRISLERVNKAYQLFFNALMDGGIESIVKIANQIFNRPVLLTDENYHQICQIPKKKIGDPIWDQLVDYKMLPTETIWAYQVEFLNNQEDHYQPFYADWGYVKDSPRIFGEITDHKRILGHIAIFLMDKPLEEGDLEIAQIFVDTLKIEMIKQQHHNGRSYHTLSSLLTDLLDPIAQFTEKHTARDRLQQRILGDYILIVTPCGNNASQKAFASYLVIEFTKKYQNVVSVLYDECIVTLIGEVLNERENRLIVEISRFLGEHDLVSGMCDSFRELDEVYFRYRQALLTARVAGAKGNTSFGAFMDYAPMQLFLEIANKDVPKVYIHPVLDQIRKYDKENNTEYYHTLRIYSLSLFNIKIAVNRLAIHRNTLNYRLNRIEDLFHLSYEDETTALHLLCSFLLLEAVSM